MKPLSMSVSHECLCIMSVEVKCIVGQCSAVGTACSLVIVVGMCLFHIGVLSYLRSVMFVV